MKEQGAKNNEREEPRQLPWPEPLIPGQETSPSLAGEQGPCTPNPRPSWRLEHPARGTMDTLLGFEVLHEVLHVPELSLQAPLVGQEPVQLPPQVADVGLEHGSDVAARGFLLLEEAPLGLQHFVLLLQEPHLRGSTGIVGDGGREGTSQHRGMEGLGCRCQCYPRDLGVRGKRHRRVTKGTVKRLTALGPGL